MISVDIQDPTYIIAFWLIFTRWVVVLIQLPIMEESTIPVSVKVLGALVMTYAFYPMLEGQMITELKTVGMEHGFWYLTIFNAAIGILIGLIIRSIMTTFISAGSIISQQIGFAAMRYFDPNHKQAVGPFEILIRWVVLIMILTSGALIPMFKGVFLSFFSINYFSLGKLVASPEFFLEFLKNLFLSSLLLASPIIFTNLVIMSVLGIIARTVPQMNVLMISFVVNIGLGLFVFAVTLSEFFYKAFDIYAQFLGQWFQLII